MAYMEKLQSKTREQLINDAYNGRVADWADYADKSEDKHGYGKRIPYIGWFWRYTDFVNKQICIGDSGDFIGVMENNKWDYPSRFLTEQEVDMFLIHLEAAFAHLDGGGSVAEFTARAEEAFDQLWNWFQTLHIGY